MDLTRRMFLHLTGATAASFVLDGFAQEWPDDPYLRGNFAPVPDERTWDDLRVVGSLPPEMDGLYLRNGPNPQFPPRGRYHWFDGDGMLHGVWIAKGRARYANRYVETRGLKKEREAKKSLHGGFRSGPPLKNAANTSVVEHHGKLLALWEGGLAHEIDQKTLATVGEYNFAGPFPHPLTAHPKIDPATGEMIQFGIRNFSKPFLTYGVVNSAGKVAHTAFVEFGRSVLVHDFAITAKHAVFLDLPLRIDMMRGLVFDREAPARLGLLPRKGTEILWHAIEPCWMWHVLCATETGDEVRLLGARWDDFENPKHIALHEWRVGPGGVKERRLDDTTIEFPRINDAHIARDARYGYAAVAGEEEFTGLVKFDLAKGTSERHGFGKGRFGGEPVFVPRGKDEDDGWVVTFVYDAASKTSEVVVVAAQDFRGKPVARILLPGRVPHGFHGIWI